MFRASTLVKITAVVILLVAAGATYRYLAQSAPKAQRDQSRERVWPVETVTVAYGPVVTRHRLFGQVVARRRADIRAAVTADIVQIPNSTLDGNRVAAGALLYQLDDSELKLALAEREAERAEIKAQGAELKVMLDSDAAILRMDRQDLRFAGIDRQRVQDLADRGRVSKRALEEATMAENDVKRRLLERQTALAVTKARRAANDAAQARIGEAIARITRDIAKTRITAPFAGILTDVTGATGKRLQQGEILAHLISLKDREVRFHIPEQIMALTADTGAGLLGRRIFLTGTDKAPESEKFIGKVARFAAEVDTTSGGQHAFATFDTALPEQLRPGSFVALDLEARKFDNVAEIPAAAVFDGDTVYAIGAEQRLQPYNVEVVARLPARILIRSAIPEGTRIVTTLLAEIGPGLKVRAF